MAKGLGFDNDSTGGHQYCGCTFSAGAKRWVSS